MGFWKWLTLQNDTPLSQRVQEPLPPLKDDRVLRCATRLLEQYRDGKTYTSADRRMIVAYQRVLKNYGYPAPVNAKEAKLLIKSLEKLQ